MTRAAKLSAAQIADQLAALNLAALNGTWRFSSDTQAISRDFQFKDFATAWTFMCRVAAAAEARDHHPDWSNVYNRVSIRLTTHESEGVTALDFQLAAQINALSDQGEAIL